MYSRVFGSARPVLTQTQLALSAAKHAKSATSEGLSKSKRLGEAAVSVEGNCQHHRRRDHWCRVFCRDIVREFSH